MKAVFIIASSNFRDEEYEIPRRILESRGVNITVASSSLNMAQGIIRLAIKPDILINDIKVEDYDCIVFVGGVGSAEYFLDDIAHNIVKESIIQSKILAAICIAPVILAKAGVLENRRVTVFSSKIREIENSGAEYTGNDVEVDGKIITAKGPEAAAKFGKELTKAMGLVEV